MFIHLSLHESVAGNRDAQSRNEKKLFMLFIINSLESVGMEGIMDTIAMDCERMVEEGINFILCLGTTYDLSSKESIGNSRSFLLTGKSMHLKIILSII